MSNDPTSVLVHVDGIDADFTVPWPPRWPTPRPGSTITRDVGELLTDLAVAHRCGWHATYPTLHKAESGLRRHSCRKWRRREAERLRGMRRRAAVDRTPQPCLHKFAEHVHGTHACYVLDRCRCRPCSRANKVYEYGRHRRELYGQPANLVDATPVRAHIAELAAAGVGLKQVAKVSGVPQGALWKLVYGKKRPDGSQTPSKRVLRRTAAAILALTPDAIADGALTDSTGTRRRVQALVCLGWSVNRLAAETGLDRQVLDGALRGRPIHAGHARAFAAVYEHLVVTPPPEHDQRSRIAASRSRTRAAAAGWAPPLAWDDDTINDPNAQPEQAGRRTTRKGTERRMRDLADLVEDIEFLLTVDPLATYQQLADRLHMVRTAVQHALERAGRDDLREQLARNAELAA